MYIYVTIPTGNYIDKRMNTHLDTLMTYLIGYSMYCARYSWQINNAALLSNYTIAYLKKYDVKSVIISILIEQTLIKN